MRHTGELQGTTTRIITVTGIRPAEKQINTILLQSYGLKEEAEGRADILGKSKDSPNKRSLDTNKVDNNMDVYIYLQLNKFP